MTRRSVATWMAGVVLPLVLGGLIVMHTVELAPAEATSPSAHAAVDTASPGAVHADHGCDGCHVGLHVMIGCVAVLGSIAVWRLTRHLLGRTSPPDTSPAETAGPTEPPPLLRSGPPSWVTLGVMRC